MLHLSAVCVGNERTKYKYVHTFFPSFHHDTGCVLNSELGLKFTSLKGFCFSSDNENTSVLGSLLTLWDFLRHF